MRLGVLGAHPMVHDGAAVVSEPSIRRNDPHSARRTESGRNYASLIKSLEIVVDQQIADWIDE